MQQNRTEKQVRTFKLPMLFSQRKIRMDTAAVVVAPAFVVLEAIDPEEVDRAEVAMCLILQVQELMHLYLTVTRVPIVKRPATGGGIALI